MPATVTVYKGHHRTLYYLPGITSLIITCIGIIMKTIFSRRTHLTEPKLGLNLPTTGAAHVTLYHTWRPSDSFTGPHGQV